MNFQRLIVREAAKAVGRKIYTGAFPAPNGHEANILARHRPKYWTASGLIECTLHKVDTSPVNGRTVAYYDLKAWENGRRYKQTFLWGLKNGQPVEIKKFPAKWLS